MTTIPRNLLIATAVALAIQPASALPLSGKGPAAREPRPVLSFLARIATGCMPHGRIATPPGPRPEPHLTDRSGPRSRAPRDADRCLPSRGCFTGPREAYGPWSSADPVRTPPFRGR